MNKKHKYLDLSTRYVNYLNDINDYKHSIIDITNRKKYSQLLETKKIKSATKHLKDYQIVLPEFRHCGKVYPERIILQEGLIRTHLNKWFWKTWNNP